MTLSLNEFHHLFDSSREGILVVSPPLLRDANHALLDMLGYTHKQLTGLPSVDALVAPADRDAITRLLKPRPPRSQADPPLHLDLLSRGGDRVAVSLKAVRTEDSWLLFFALDKGDAELDSVRRMADRGAVRTRTKELEESRNRYRNLVENLADGLVTLNQHGEFLFVNKAFAKMLGHRARSRLVARHLLDFVVERDVERVRRGLKRWENGELTRFQASLQTSDGEEAAVLLSGRALPKGPAGEARGVLLLVTDFAERQALSERLALARKMDALSSLAGGIAHDFNNLLTGILGNASRIRLSTADPEIDSLARSVEDSAELAARLTQRLMALVRGQAPHRRLLDVAELIRHTLGLLGKVMPESIELVTQFAPGIAPVMADESQLQQAILNLCINARDAMVEAGGSGRLTIEVRMGSLQKPMDDGSMVEEAAIILRVSDTGPGVPPKLRERVFDPFFTTKGLGRGIGLGLATVYQLVDAHGGTIDLDEAEGGGARFTLRLPAQPGREAQAHSQPSRTLTERRTGSGTVLLAEDEDAIRNLVAEALRAHGYSVLAAADGAEAIELWKANSGTIDLLFLDVRMPRADGPEVLRRAREDRPQVAAVFSSGFIPEETEREEVFSHVLFLPKPYRVPDLIDAVSRALQIGDSLVAGTTGGMAPLVDTTIPGIDTLSAPGQGMDAGRTVIDHAPVTDQLEAYED
jgi:two-component system, cell cycle sensor histidine kinase and response regulator CckA